MFVMETHIDPKRIVADGYDRMGEEFATWNSERPPESTGFLDEVLASLGRRIEPSSKSGAGPGTDAADLPPSADTSAWIFRMAALPSTAARPPRNVRHRRLHVAARSGGFVRRRCRLLRLHPRTHRRSRADPPATFDLPRPAAADVAAPYHRGGRPGRGRLGVPMFFARFTPRLSERLLRDTGFPPGGLRGSRGRSGRRRRLVEFHWVIARKPLAASGPKAQDDATVVPDDEGLGDRDVGHRQVLSTRRARPTRLSGRGDGRSGLVRVGRVLARGRRRGMAVGRGPDGRTPALGGRWHPVRRRVRAGIKSPSTTGSRLILLTAPAELLLDRIASRTTNDWGKAPPERELILHQFATVEPLLRAGCTHELDAQPASGRGCRRPDRDRATGLGRPKGIPLRGTFRTLAQPSVGATLSVPHHPGRPWRATSTWFSPTRPASGARASPASGSKSWRNRPARPGRPDRLLDAASAAVWRGFRTVHLLAGIAAAIPDLVPSRMVDQRRGDSGRNPLPQAGPYRSGRRRFLAVALTLAITITQQVLDTAPHFGRWQTDLILVLEITEGGLLALAAVRAIGAREAR